MLLAVAGVSGGAALLAASATASAQDYTYLLLVDYGPGESSVHPGNPSATVRVWATLKESDWAWARGNLDLTASEGEWTDFDLILGEHGHFGATRGVLSDDLRTIDGILALQFNPPFEPPPNRDHPLLIWEGVWSMGSAGYMNRDVNLTTSDTSIYRVFVTDVTTSTDKSSEFVPGSGSISVTPAPTTTMMGWLIAGLLLRRVRRRVLPITAAEAATA